MGSEVVKGKGVRPLTLSILGRSIGDHRLYFIKCFKTGINKAILSLVIKAGTIFK
ncbi:hypothetical protein psyc5s11_17450 [Clostridium gelidum]|uniref:Uncharacterized protein n=1 Tax=Clostridium gelidum TaxID=704125 RepID=A0ABM7T323_9CLOT|nr:hypothetical protein psyc5s11_17450 [Clostridium gelidum]